MGGKKSKNGRKEVRSQPGNRRTLNMGLNSGSGQEPDMKLFISYSRDDKQYVHELAEALKD